jgi:acetyltransferase
MLQPATPGPCRPDVALSKARSAKVPGRHTALDDGTPFVIRQILPQDKALSLAFLRGLSRETRFQRLLSNRDLMPGELRRLTEIDTTREMALIATVHARDGREEQIGVARYVREGSSAELAIVIGDRWQRRGIGKRLLKDLLGEAADAGVEAMTAISLSTNLAMLRLAKKFGFELSRQPGDATLMRMTKKL